MSMMQYDICSSPGGLDGHQPAETIGSTGYENDFLDQLIHNNHYSK
jgi:hypothetical protein